MTNSANAVAVPSPVSMNQMKSITEKQAARIALQDAQIQELTAALKQQAEQIQKVSAQLEASKPAPQVVVSNP